MKAHKERKHSRLAPSKASTWTVCTASVQLIDALEAEGKIKDEQSVYAKEGEQAHEVCEALLKGKRIPHDPSNEMLDHCKAFVKYCESFGGAGEDHSEIDVPLFYLREDTGSVDFLAIDRKAKHIHVIDLKYGAGVAVDAVRNKQTAIYARSAIEHYVSKPKGDWQVTLHIYQPRTQDARDTGIPYSRWTLSLDELMLFTEKEIGVPAQLILDDARHLLKFVPSNDACKWCPAKGDCAARTQWLLDGTPMRRLIDEDIVLPLGALTDGEKLTLLQRDSEIRDMLDAVKKSMWQSARDGKPLPGTKLVEGRGSRNWLDEKQAEKFLCKQLGKDAAFTPRTLISPPQAEKLIEDNELLKPLILRKPGAPILALADDKRREWHDVSAQKEFLDQDLADALEDAI